MKERDRLVLIGHPVDQSLSPAMHNAALRALGLELRYEALDVLPEDLGQCLAQMARTRCGGNFTMPHKKAAMQQMRVTSDAAHRAGVVNTFWGDGYGALDGDNTDVTGFNGAVADLLGDLPRDARVAVIGTGGAAAAALTAIEGWSGASVSVHARDLARASSFRMRFSVVVRACSVRDPCLSDADLVINATSVGMSGNQAMPVELHRLKPEAAVLDLVYGADETSLVRGARAAGHRAADGLRMLLHQGTAAFTLWLDVEPDREVMWSALLQATGRSQ